ncbi:MAG TPA: redoxin domain-containing protein [Terriglobia bacterium]|nr:redoxin domain-containing protein [Terriglobia bacterium]
MDRATRQYSNLKSYRITCRQSFSSRHGTSPPPTTITAIKAPGGRYRFESNIGFGTAIQVSNGKFVWYYHATENAYARQPATGKGPVFPEVLGEDDGAIEGAANLVGSVAWYNGHFKSAMRVPDETLTLSGRRLSCYVIVLTNRDRKIPGPYPFTDNIWIEKGSFKVRKIVESYITTFNQPGSPPVTYPAARVSIFPEVQLNQPIQDSAFHFTPPPTAHMVPAFQQDHLQPPPRPESAAIYRFILKSFSGSQVALSRFRGQAILIDVWATWCAPCYEAFPELGRIYQQTRGTGLVVVSIDQSDIAKDAQAYIEKMHYPWQNFHDDGKVDQVFGNKPIPRTILIDAKGEIVFDEVSPTEQQLRAAIAKLGPPYAAALARM